MSEQSLAVGVVTFLGGVFFTNLINLFRARNEQRNARRDNTRDDFDVVTDKLKEIIDHQDSQITAAQSELERMKKEQVRLRRNLAKARTLARELRGVLSDIQLDEATRKKVDDLHQQFVVNDDDIIG